MRLLNSKASSVIVFACLVASLTSLVYSTNMHSDILFMKYLLDDISSGGNWSDWRFSPAPSYFPDLLIYALAYSATGLAPVQIMLTTAAQAIIITLLSIALIRRLNPSVSQAAKLAIMALTLLCVITTSQYTLESRIGIFFGSNNIQVPTMISSLALLWLALSITEQKSAIKAIAFLLIGALGYASSAVFIICFTLPFIATLTIIATRSKIGGIDNNLKPSIFILLLLIASQAIGYALSNAITFNSPLDGRIPISFDGARSSATQFLKATQFIFDPSTPTAFFTALVFLAAFVYALFKGGKLLLVLFKWNKVKPVSMQEQLVGLFFLLTTASSFFGAIVSGGFMDKFGYRYFETFIALSAIVSIHFIDKSFGEKAKNYATTCIAIISALVTTASIVSLEYSRSLPFSELLEHGAFKDQEQSTASCLDNLIGSGVPLKAGVADYWMSRGVMFYAKNNIFINQSTDQLLPYFWISSIGPIRHPEKYNASVYNFVIANNEPLGHIMKFDTESMKSKVPPGYNIFSCTGSTSEVLYYQSNNLDSHLKEIQKKFLLSKLGHGSATFSGSELPGLIGQVDGTSRSASAQDGSGILAFGPYISLPHGKYVATLEFNAEQEGDASPGRIEIGRFGEKAPTIFYSGDLPKDRRSVDIKFSIQGKALDQIETHVTFNGVGSLTVHSLRFAEDQ
jgi:hypothetical protein